MSFDEAFSFSSLFDCHKKCRRNKQHKNETVEFEMNISRKISDLSKKILAGNYYPTNYRSFCIHEPKKRVIDSLSYLHRIVQRSICDNILRPRLENYLIFDNAACRKNKGTRFALERLKKFIKLAKLEYGDSFYFFQGDIKKYFQSINHNILKEQIKKLNFEPKTKKLIFRYIDSYEYEIKNGQKVGIPIGNQTSQWFALLYLNIMDRFIKEKLKIKFYIRYMDDFIFLHNDHEYIKYCHKEINNLVNRLGLSLNRKTQVHNITRGISFLGFRTMLTKNGKIIRLIRGTTKKNLLNKCKKILFMRKHNVVNENYSHLRFVAFKNHYFLGTCHKWFYDHLRYV